MFGANRLEGYGMLDRARRWQRCMGDEELVLNNVKQSNLSNY